jgi:hypothetical protein
MGAVSVFAAYNKIAEATGWPIVQSETPSREKVASQRIKECGGFDNWRDAMERASKSDFLSGRATGSTPATFDWLNKPANFTKIMEGNYDNRTNNRNQSNRTQGRQNRVDPALEQALRLAGLSQASGDAGNGT